MPAELKYLGNEYIINEFKLHRKAEPDYLKGFTKAWSGYKADLEAQLKEARFGVKLDTRLDDLSPQQLGQLMALRESSKDVK